MQAGDPLQLCLQRLVEHRREHTPAVSVALALADEDLPVREVEVLHAQPEGFGEAQAGPVEQADDEAIHAPNACEHSLRLVRRQHHGEPVRPARALRPFKPSERALQHVPVEEQQGREGLILRAGDHVAVGREVGEKGRDVRFGELQRMAGTVEEDVPPDPLNVALLRPVAEWAAPAYGAGGGEELLLFRGHDRRKRGRLDTLRIGALHCKSSRRGLPRVCVMRNGVPLTQWLDQSPPD